MSGHGALSNKSGARLLKEHEAKSPPRYDDLTGQIALSELPTGRRVLTVLICTVVALGSALLLLTHFQR